jgi:Tol biopolymer transport system component/DNA-binding winged helix-turn-helix (wHTH) protein
MTEHKCFVFRFADVEVVEREFCLIKAGDVLSVEPKAFRVLLFLLRNPQKLITKDELLDAVWPDSVVTDNSLARSIALLRRLLGDDTREPRFIATVASVGYRLICTVEVSEDAPANLTAPDRPNISDSEFAVPPKKTGVTETTANPPAQTGVGTRGETMVEIPPYWGGWRFRRQPLGHHFPGVAPTALITTRTNRRQWALLAACVGCVLLAGLLVQVLKPAGQNIGNYSYKPFVTDAMCAMWSPDGKSIAYAQKINGTYQIFLRYLNSPVAIQLTHETHYIELGGWSSDRMHVLFVGFPDTRQPNHLRLYSVATVGGKPEVIMDYDCTSCNVSPDGKVLATFTKEKETEYGLEISDPLGSPLRTYTPAPFATKVISNFPRLGVSPDGKKILLIVDDESGKEETWLLPYPAGSQPPRHLLQKLTTFYGTPGFSWMPDSRHVVVSFAADQNSSPHLWMADTESAELTPLTAGTATEMFPAVAPDGKSVLYIQTNYNLDVVSLSLEDGSVTTLIHSGRVESMASFSANLAKEVWVSNRNGPYEVWVRQPDGAEQPVVTAADFAPGTNKWFISPAIAPDGDRIIYERVDSSGVARLWISSLSGGPPVRLTNEEPGSEESGSWSPDGSRFVYTQIEGAKHSLMTIRTSGSAAPSVLRDLGELSFIPDWSPVGDWITYRDDNGWHLISPNGKTSKFLGKLETPYLAFSRDAKLLYGIQTRQTEADQDHAILFSLDPVTLKQKVLKELGRDLVPSSNLDPGIRFSFAPDGKSFVYTTARYKNDFWILQGLRQPGWLDRVRSSFKK